MSVMALSMAIIEMGKKEKKRKKRKGSSFSSETLLPVMYRKTHESYLFRLVL